MSHGPRYLYKFLARGALSPFTHVAWKKPNGREPDGWMEAPLPLVPCDQGIHVCRSKDLAYWFNEELWRCEVSGEMQEGINSLVVQRARLVGRVEAWTPGYLAKLLPRFLETLPGNPEVDRYTSAARDLVAKNEPFAAAYAAAIAAGKAALPNDETAAFHAARAAQGEMIALELGLA